MTSERFTSRGTASVSAYGGITEGFSHAGVHARLAPAISNRPHGLDRRLMSKHEISADVDADADVESRDEILQPTADDPATATAAERVYLARLAAWETEGGRVRAP